MTEAILVFVAATGSGLAVVGWLAFFEERSKRR